MQILRRIDPNAVVVRPRWNMHAPLLSLSKALGDHWTISDACEHTLIMGGTGSGKSTASGVALAHAFLRAQFGGLVLCAKPDERARWQKYAADCNRSQSLLIVNGSGQHRFNFLDYLMNRPKQRGGGIVYNAVEALIYLVRLLHGGDIESDNPDFWLKAIHQLITLALLALYHAYGKVSLDGLLKIINSAPKSEEEARDIEFQRGSFCYQTVRKLFENPAIPIEPREAAIIAEYFGQTFGRLDPKTRSNIVVTLSAELGPFLTGTLHALFCTDTTFTPEVTHEGVVVVFDLPVKQFDKVGAVAQTFFKYLWQKETEARAVDEGTRPVFLWMDEGHLFTSPYDMEFLSTARSARAATVLITQNLPTLYASIGGRHPVDRVDAMLGNYQTKIFHANSDHRTNTWAADAIGRAMQRRQSRNWSEGASGQASSGRNGSWGVQEGESSGQSWGSSTGFSYNGAGDAISINHSTNRGGQSGTSSSRTSGGGWSTGTSYGHSTNTGGGWSEQMDYVIQPSDFANKLRQGGQRNNFMVDAVFFQANRVFSRTGSCWTPISFRQKVA
jgi:hypothetical protein